MSEELVMIPQNAVEVFNPEAMTDFLCRVREEATSVVYDVNTNEGRNGIRSMAFKIAKTKTALDKAGKELVEPLKAKAKLVDEERKRARDELESLQKEVRKPLTEWEDKEKARVAKIDETIAHIKQIGEASYEDIDSINSAIEAIKADSSFDFQEKSDEASEVIELASLRLDKRKLEIVERDNAISAQKKAEEEARIAAEAARKEREEKERAEREERIRIEAKREAEARAAREAAAREEAAEREAQRKIDDERRRAEEAVRAAERAKVEAEQAAKRERDRIEAERKAEEEARKAREADKAHRVKIETEAVEALENLASSLGHDLSPLSIISAIEAGKIPHVTINF